MDAQVMPSAVTFGQETRREVIDRYVVALTQPLIQPHVAQAAKDDVALLLAFDRDPWVLRWVAAFLRCVINSLPANDPWRGLAGQTESRVIPAAGVELPEHTNGVWSRGGHSFGTVLDALDLVRIDSLDWQRDRRLAPLAERLSITSGMLLAAAGHAPDAVFDVLIELREADAFQAEGRATVWDEADVAIRWALHRRSEGYGLTSSDQFILFAASAASQAADAGSVSSYAADPSNWCAAVARVGKIDESTYPVIKSETAALDWPL